MENSVYFKSVEVTGTTKEEAFAKAPFTAPQEMWINATAKFKNWKAKQTDGITNADVKQFMLDYIKEKKIAPGSAAYIVDVAAKKDTRERPYRYESVKNEGSRKWKNVFRAYDKATGEVLAELCDKENKRATKADAENMCKKLYCEKGFHGDIVLKKEKIVKEGNATVGEFFYTPSKDTQVGVFRCFGLLQAE